MPLSDSERRQNPTRGDIEDISVNVSNSTFVQDSEKAGDASHVVADPGLLGHTVRRDADTGLASADGKRQPPLSDDKGRTKVRVMESALPADAATQTTLAAVLAKLSADPANQTTLAAVLAKLTADPATQTTLAALLTELQLKADLSETQPVSGTFWQATQPVSAASLPLPSGAATSANQQTNALTDAQLRASAVPVSGAFFQATQPVSAASLPLPSGAATAAAQYVQRPSEKAGGTRTYKSQVAAEGISASAAGYSVTSGKTLYVTSFLASLSNTSTTQVGKVRVRDGGIGGTIRGVFQVPAAVVGTSSPHAVYPMSFMEPKRFSTDIHFEVVSGTVSFSHQFTGYEE